jgi:Fibronectin type III domain
MSRLFVALFALVLSFNGVPAFAQEALSTDAPPVPPSPAALATSPLNCFDYYTFGSVQVNLQPTLAQTVPGSTLTFTGALWNANPYPVLDGTLYVKIFHRNNTTADQGDGSEVVDQFIIQEGVTVAASSTIPLQYEWKVPVNAQGGEYYAAYFFTTAKQYNLMGLSFTDDVVGNQAPFIVTAENNIAKLSKVDTTVNEKDYDFSSVYPHFPIGETVVIKTTITNPSAEAKTLPLQWNQYAWDAMNEDNLRFTKTEVITLAPNETKEVSYEVQFQRESVVYVVATTQDNEAKSILNIRYVRDGVEETRINFSGLTTFPLAKDTQQTFFACAHSTNMPVVPGNILTLTLKDKSGAVIHEYKYEGDISIVGGGFGETFSPTKNINYATLTTTLERNGVMVEEVVQTYDCATIDPNSCLPEDIKVTSLSDYFKTHIMNILLIGGLVLLVIAAMVFLIRKRRNHIDASQIKMTTPLLLLFFVTLGMFYGVESVSAQYTWGFTPNSVTGPVAASRPVGTYATQAELNSLDTTNSVCLNCLSGLNAASTLGLTQSDFDRFANLGTGYYFVPVPHPSNPNKYAWIGGVGSVSNAYLLGQPMNFVSSVRSVPSTDNFEVCGFPMSSLAFSSSANNGNTTGAGGGSGVPCTTYTPAPTASISANPINIDLGNTTRLTWTSENAEYCDITSVDESGRLIGGDWFFFMASSGSVDVSPVVNTRYRVICTKFTWQGLNAIFQSSAPDYVTVTVNNSVVNTVPNPPTISGPTTGQINTSYTFNIAGTDPDGNTLRYGLDLNGDDSVDQWLPGSGYVNSGTAQNSNRIWTSVGTYTFRALTQDSNGANSGWTTHTITITAAPAPTADLTINGSNGPINVAKNATINLNWTSANAASCTKWGGAWGSGQAIPLSGSDTTVVTATTDYMINCGGVTDTVRVNVVNQAPNPPTISYTSGTLETGQTITFSIQGSDPDNDNVFYEIDWDNNGSTDATTMTVSSGTTQPATHTWSTIGMQTFQARTVDSVGVASTWTTHTITISLAPPPTPSAPSLTAAGACNSGSITASWSSVAGATGYDLQYQTNPSGAWTIITDIPSPQTVTSLSNGTTYNFQVRAKNSAGHSAWSGYGTTNTAAACPIPTATINAANCDIPAGSGSCTTNVTWSSADTIAPVSVQQAGTQFSTAANQASAITRTLSYGLTTFTLTHDSGTTVTSRDVVASCTTGTAWDSVSSTCLPDPQLTLTATPAQVKSGQTAVITWSVGVVYNMNCTVQGPGINPAITFNPSVNGASYGSPHTTGAITAKSTYSLTCTSGTASFTDTAIVETQGVVEET